MADAPQKPSVGRMVHYVSQGHSLGTNGSTSTCRAAIITEVKTDAVVSLAVFTTKGTLFHADLSYDDGKSAASWHWPERTDAPTSSIFPARTREKKPPPGVATA